MTDPRPAPPDRVPLDRAPLAEVVGRVLASRHPAAVSVRDRTAELAAVADLVCSRFAAGGRLLVLAPDPAAEQVTRPLERTFTHEYGFAPGAVRVAREVAALRRGPRDAVLVVTTHDGFAGVESRAGVAVVTTAADPGGAEVVVALDGAGDAAAALTAALDAVATAVAATLGHLYDEHPVDLVADDDADRARVVQLVAAIAGVDEVVAGDAAVASGHDVRVAVLVLAGRLSASDAATLAANRRTLRDALEHLPPQLPSHPLAATARGDGRPPAG